MAYHITSRCSGCGDCVGICPTDAISGEEGTPHTIDRSLCIECGACGRVCKEAAVEDIFGTIIAQLPRTEWLVPHVSIQACTACGICVDICPARVLVMIFDEYHEKRIPALAYPRSCVSCGWCVEHCQFSALSMQKLVL